MADGEKSRDNLTKPRQRALPMCSTSKFRAGADADLIEYVRARPVLYDPDHSRYMDNVLKNAIWIKIGKELRASPNACKARWYNIRDNYRKALRRRSLSGDGKLQYKFASILGFMDRFYKGQLDVIPANASSTKTELSEDSNDGSNDDSNDDSNDFTEAAKKAVPQKADLDVNSDAEAMSNVSESVVDYPIFDKPITNVSNPHPGTSSQSQVVDAFLAAIGPMLKNLSPYHLSLAKADIFATVHKYELKGIVENGWASRDVNPLPE